MSSQNLAELVTHLQPIAEVVSARQLAHERYLPVAEPLAGLVPYGGLVRGTTVGVRGSGAVTSLTFALIAEATRTGSWLVSIGFDHLNWTAAREMGVALERVVTVDLSSPSPSARAGSMAAEVISAAMDAAELVMVAPSIRVPVGLQRRLHARARERGVVLLHPHPTRTQGGWSPEAATCELWLEVVDSGWEGLGRGWGYAAARWAEVQSSGRGVGARVRRQRIWLPSADGRVATSDAWPAQANLA